MKFLITGANGLLGHHLIPFLAGQGHEVWATGQGPCRLAMGADAGIPYRSVDIRDAAAVERLLQEAMPDVLVHAAAKTQVDDCEQHRQEAFEINVTGTRNLLEATAPNVHFIYLSTDFVFNGREGDYDEDAVPDPVNWYGHSKWQAEQLLGNWDGRWSIVRTCLVYGVPLPGGRGNILTWMKDNLESGQPIRVVSDQYRTPTFVMDLATGLSQLAASGATGIFHVSGEEKWTPYEMALYLAEFLELDASLITRVDAGSFVQPGKRPQKTGFRIARAKAAFGFQPRGFGENLALLFGPSS